LSKVLTQSDVLKQYSQKISVAYQKQQFASQAILQSIIEIGELLTEARNYKDSLVLKHKDRLWESFQKNLQFSPSSVAKYISIANNKFIKTKKNHKYLPSSVYSLYEISKLDSLKLNQLVESGKLTSTIGRSDVKQLLIGKKSTSKLSKQVEVLTIKVDEDDWESNFQEIKDELIAFLENKRIAFDYSSIVKQTEREQKNYHLNVEKFAFRLAKKFVKAEIKKFIEYKGISSNLWHPKDKLSFKSKYKKLKFGEEEVDVSFCTNISELQNMYLYLGLEGQNYWLEMVDEWYAEAYSQIKLPKSLLISQNLSNTEVVDFELPPKSRKLNFTGVKV
jgi:hypothetical protein